MPRCRIRGSPSVKAPVLLLLPSTDFGAGLLRTTWCRCPVPSGGPAPVVCPAGAQWCPVVPSRVPSGVPSAFLVLAQALPDDDSHETC
jgi:hypothetical protein